MKTRKKPAPTGRFTRGEKVAGPKRPERKEHKDESLGEEGNAGAYGHPRRPDDAPTA